ncbi:FR47-like protein [Carpediemonas membranifera]|uniref:FR47-like protein n=1 Tax=Carpediemonas membranifera TaxID=201153 RepID=A0A8J6AVI2_9EUKA|nr:FR47-like protein [Carpediemonas membranifera]|eukprot:KAG9393560.1 FR47-like protein [Carpediemonas membranifera]
MGAGSSKKKKVTSRCVYYDGSDAFLAALEPVLLREPGRHSFMFGIVHNCEEFHGFGVYRGDELVLVAIQTPPRPLVAGTVGSHEVSKDEVALLIDEVAANDLVLPGINADVAVAEMIAAEHAYRSGQLYEEDIHLNLYALDSSPESTGGELRAPTEAELPLVNRWVSEFYAEVIHEPDRACPAMGVGEMPSLALWVVDGAPVSMLQFVLPTPASTMVTHVYTPPDNRGKGYATGMVAAAAAKAVQDKGLICLHAHAANPASNQVYRTVGFDQLLVRALYYFKLP